ncbi:MAG: MFS transporter [Proteobacteria bacterium]|nr:MFS transporter [Pseudomonadota bacterium]
MIAAIAATWALLLGMALLMIGNGLQASLVGLRATLEGFSTTTTGLVMSGFYVGFMLGSILTPMALRRVGHVRVFAALAALGSIAALVHAVYVEPVSWTLMRILTGLCYAGLYVVAESWLNDRATNQTRGRLLSVYVVISLGGMGIGQLLLNLASVGGFELFILASILLSVAVVPILLSAGPTPSFTATARLGLRRLYAISPLGVIGTMGTGLANGVLIGMGAVFGGKAGLSAAQISLFMGAMFLGGVLLQWPIGRLSDRFDRRLVITFVTFLAAFAALGAIVLSGISETGLYIFIALLGGLSLPLYSLCIAHANDHLEPSQMIAASASLVLVMGIGASLGPLTAGALMSVVGPNGYFWCLAVVHGAIGVFALYRMTMRPAVPLDDQALCVPITSQASPVAASAAPLALRDAMDADLAKMSRR